MTTPMGPDDPRWPAAIALLDLAKAQLERIERMFGDDPDPQFQLDLIERKHDLAATTALVYDPRSLDERPTP